MISSRSIVQRSCAQRINAGGLIGIRSGGRVVRFGWKNQRRQQFSEAVELWAAMTGNRSQQTRSVSSHSSSFVASLDWGWDQPLTSITGTRYLTTTESKTRIRTGTGTGTRNRKRAGGGSSIIRKKEKGGMGVGGASSIDVDFYNDRVGKKQEPHRRQKFPRSRGKGNTDEEQHQSADNRRGNIAATTTNDDADEQPVRYNRTKRGARKERKALVNVLLNEAEAKEEAEEEEQIQPAPQRMFREDWIEKRRNPSLKSNNSSKNHQPTEKKRKTEPPAGSHQAKHKQHLKLEEEFITHFPPFRCDVFASCLPGLEPILQQEMKEKLKLDKRILQVQPGGVEISKSLSMEELLDCHLHLGTASHILLRCGKPFVARGLPELTRKVSKQPWSHFLLINNNATKNDDGAWSLPIKMKITTKKSKLNHKTAIRRAILEGINESLKINNRKGAVYHAKEEEEGREDEEEKSDEEPFLRMVVRIDHDEVQLSIATWKTPMHKRGYRLETARAPLRLDIAFAMIYGAGWRGLPNMHLLDPFCGSGTIAIEAASIAAGLPPGRLKGPPLYGTIWYRPKQWKQKLDKVLGRVRMISPRHNGRREKAHDKSTTIQQQQQQLQQRVVEASDRDEGAIDAAKANAERAGVQDWIDFRAASISDAQKLRLTDEESNSTTGCHPLLIATNPPWGMRVAADKGNRNRKKKKNRVHPLLPLYQTLLHKQNRLNQNGRHVMAVTLLQDPNLFRKTGEADSMQVMFSSQHGGVPVAAVLTGPSIYETSSTAPIKMHKSDDDT